MCIPTLTSDLLFHWICWSWDSRHILLLCAHIFYRFSTRVWQSSSSFSSPPLFCLHFFQTMTKTQRHQQEALWEFVHTELSYINKLIIIKDVCSHSLPADIVSFNFFSHMSEPDAGFSTGCLTKLCLLLTVGYGCSRQPAPTWISPRGQCAERCSLVYSGKTQTCITTHTSF